MESTKTLMWKEMDESTAAPDDDKFAFTYVRTGDMREKKRRRRGTRRDRNLEKKRGQLGRDSFKCALGERLSTVVVTAMRQLS